MWCMSEPTAHSHHAIDYIELTVTDIAAAKAFYAAAFGWSFTDYGPDYAGIQGMGRSTEMGGFARGEPAAGAGPLVVLYSHDLEATLQSVEAAGATIVTPPFTFPGGRRFHFADPSGNVLAVWTVG